MLTHADLREGLHDRIIRYVETRHGIVLTLDDANRLSVCYRGNTPCKWADTSLDAWLKLRLLERFKAHFNPPTEPPGDIARFLSYMEHGYLFDGYPKDYADRERAKIESFQRYIRTGDAETYVAETAALVGRYGSDGVQPVEASRADERDRR